MQQTAIELFAGVGGFHLGLSRSGWKVVWADQWEPGKKSQWAYQCYKSHFESAGTKCVNEDISKIETEAIPATTLLVGGFPCQDYSVATSNAHGIEGKKGVLWWYIERILKDNIKNGTPIPYVLLENVDRLLKSPSKQRGRDFGIILSCLNTLGYVAEWRVINAAEYGYPQKRRRTFIFATLAVETIKSLYSEKSDSRILTKYGFFPSEFPCKPKGTHDGLSICLWPDLVKMTNHFEFNFQNSGYMKDGRVFTLKVTPSNIFDRSGGKSTLGSILEDKVDERYIIPKEWIGDEADRGTDEFKKTWRYCKGAKDEARLHKNGHAYRYNEGGIPFPDKLDEPSRTMLTCEGNRRPNRICHLIPIDPENNLYRVLTPVETERLNGFDDEWTNCMPEKWRYFCMGNALVVGVIEQMGRKLKTLVDAAGMTKEGTIKVRTGGGSIIGPIDMISDTSNQTKNEVTISSRSKVSKRKNTP
jgi:DNA (cytosine-5)-methyltransferase 1